MEASDARGLSIGRAAESAVRRSRVRVVALRGVRWHVWEGAALADGRVADGPVPHLFFASERGVRRVRCFPDAWYELTDGALMALRDGS